MIDPNNPYEQQERWEFDTWLAFLAGRKPVRYLEIGSCFGHTFDMTLRRVSSMAYGVSVDLGADIQGFNSGAYMNDICTRLSLNAYEVTRIVGNSHDKDVVMRAAKAGPYDVVFIDGDHTFEGVEQDWENYGGLAPVIGFHDIAHSDAHCGVPMFWSHLKDQHRHMEIVHPTAEVPHSLGFGIGVIFR